ncbi:MAG: hypothetical protein F4099_08295 [Synechococcus sp. SB0673_bin_10]|nr:hypothetical protein [Synechococcus sp. SB0675_bin_7]MYI72480.1 hypothetical protein [Synechococcus sp. SB0673_bin_10]MYK85681.1 hypothetical protein [Synechococcus sp. SB0669_bin_7]
METALGICDGCAYAGFLHTSTGTATYKGDAQGIFRLDLFGTIYGNKDDPTTLTIDEYGYGGPRISLTLNFDKNYLDEELTARRPAGDIRSVPSGNLTHAPTFVMEYHATNQALEQTNQPTNPTFGDYADDATSLDAEMREVVVRWNGVPLSATGNQSFEGQGLSGIVYATCANGNNASCASQNVVDPASPIAGYINHPRFFGTYGAARCSGNTCPGFDLPAVPESAQNPSLRPRSWGPWDDLPLATQQAIAAIPDPQSLG